MSFNSDTTYCSVYENLNFSQRRNKPAVRKLSDSKFLDKVHQEILLHWEGKKLIGKFHVEQYMKQISKMKFKSYKDQYYVEKIKLNLLKIHKLTKHFEESLSLGEISDTLDPIGNCSFTQDFNLINEVNEPKQILLRSVSVNVEKSFPLDILTNDNFITPISQTVNSSTSKSGAQDTANKQQLLEETANSKAEKLYDLNTLVDTNKNARDLESLLSETSEVYIANYSDYTSSSVYKHPSTEESAEYSCAEHNNSINSVFQNTDLPVSSSNAYHKTKQEGLVKEIPNGQMEVDYLNTCAELNENAHSLDLFSLENSEVYIEDYTKEGIHKELFNSKRSEDKSIGSYQANKCNPEDNQPSQIRNMSTHDPDDKAECSVYENKIWKAVNNIIPTVSGVSIIKENYIKHSQNVNLKSVLKLGNNFGKTRAWQDIQNELDHEEHATRGINHALSELFEKVSLKEQESEENEYREKWSKKGNSHNFCEEDEKKLDFDSLRKRNKTRLEKISQDLKEIFNFDTLKVPENDDNYEGLNWKICVN